MVGKKYKQEIRSLSDKDLHRLERNIEKLKNRAFKIGIPASLIAFPLGIASGAVGAVLSSGAIGASTIGGSELSDRLDVIHNEIEKRNKIRREGRKRLVRELRLHSKSKLRRVM